MIKQSLIRQSRVNRYNITDEAKPGNNSADILLPYVFDTSLPALSMVLSATDPIDTNAATAAAIIAAYLTATEATDASDIDANALIAFALDVLEAIDTAAVTVEAVIDAIFDAIENKDIAEIYATTAGERNAVLDATEPTDRASITIRRPSVPRARTFIADYTRYERTRYINRLVLNAKEMPDTAKIIITSQQAAIVSASEAADGCAVYFRTVTHAVAPMSENIDETKNDEPKFRAHIEDLYARYEREQIMALLNAA